MSLVYKCDFYGTTTDVDNRYKFIRSKTISGNQINGVDVELKITIELSIPTISEPIHASVPAWKDAAQLLKNWLDATFP